MTQTLQAAVAVTENDERTLAGGALRGRGGQEAERQIEPFASELAMMTREERISASRYSFNRWERWVYAARYPDEVPLVNGEFEWIALYAE